MRKRNSWVSKVGAVAAVLALGAAGTVIAQSRLQIGGSTSNFGRGALHGGFMPDPFTVSITSGGNLDASTMSLGSGCQGFVTRQPDYILDYSAPSSFLRIYYEGSGDTTLVVNDGRGHWHCNDDSFGGLDPTVDLSRPPAGQYDIWVGSYRANENIHGSLRVTELRTQHP
jgi:hypothetical protein